MNLIHSLPNLCSQGTNPQFSFESVRAGGAIEIGVLTSSAIAFFLAFHVFSTRILKKGASGFSRHALKERTPLPHSHDTAAGFLDGRFGVFISAHLPGEAF